MLLYLSDVNRRYLPRFLRFSFFRTYPILRITHIVFTLWFHCIARNRCDSARHAAQRCSRTHLRFTIHNHVLLLWQVHQSTAYSPLLSNLPTSIILPTVMSSPTNAATLITPYDLVTRTHLSTPPTNTSIPVFATLHPQKFQAVGYPQNVSLSKAIPPL